MSENKENIFQKKDIIILGFETSCDETSVSVVKNGREILSNVVATQIPIHRRFGGVVPEVASRNHVVAISNITREALLQAGLTFDDVDALAVTYGAGLVGALLVGVNYAKSLAYALKKPLVAVNHIEGHIAANYLTHQDLKPPFVCLLMSGGHTALLDVFDFCKHNLIGTTIDDAVGECFDKVARVLSLPYPGGPEVDKLACGGNENIKFKSHSSLASSFNFSFSGLKTAVINYVHNQTQAGAQISKSDVCASFQKTVCDELVEKTIRACKSTGRTSLVIAGGVSANSQIRKQLLSACQKNNIKCFFPELKLCTDNAAMIASAAYFMIAQK